MGKSTISMAMFNSYVSLPEGNKLLHCLPVKHCNQVIPFRGNIIWAIGKTSIEKCDLGSKLSFLGLHYIVLQYILIASSASPGKLHAESLFTPPLRVLGIFDCPALSFPALQLYGGCGVIPANATANHSCTILSPAQKQALNSVCWRKPGWALTATCSMPFIHSPASAQQTIDLVQRHCLGYLHLG